MDVTDKCLEDAITSILSQTNSQEQIHAVLYPVHKRDYGMVLGNDNTPVERPNATCKVDSFYLSVNSAGKRYTNIFVGDVPRLHDQDSLKSNYHPEAIKKIQNDAAYLLRRLMKTERPLIFTSNLMKLKREKPTKEFVDKLCPQDDLKKSIALQYINQ